MKLCALQIPFAVQPEKAEESTAMLIELLNSCDDTCDIILTPEYSNAPGAFPDNCCIPFAAAHTGKLLQEARNAAIRCNAIVAVSYAAEIKPGEFRNTTEIFDRSGKSAGRFYKQHLTAAEKNSWKIASEYTNHTTGAEIIEVDGIRFGALICYDTYFTEYTASLAAKHPDIVLISSFQRAERKDIIRMQCVSTAFNCNAFVLRASVSMGENAKAGGNSMAVAPDGTILGEFGNQCGCFSCTVKDVKEKFMRSNSYGGSLIPNDRFIEQGRTTWSYRPAGPMTVLPDRLMPYPRVCAHRGFNSIMPENSLAAWGAAIALGAEEIEADVRFTADGIPVIAHDSNLDRISDGKGFVEEKTFAELCELDFSGGDPRFKGLKITTLEDLLRKFARHAILNLHLKTANEDDSTYPDWQMRKIVSLLEKYDQKEHVYFMGSDAVMETALRTAPEITRCMGAFPDPPNQIERAIKYQCRKVQLFAPFYDDKMIAKAKQAGLICNLFFCDTPEDVAKHLASGIDTILTNDYLSIAQQVHDLKK